MRAAGAPSRMDYSSVVSVGSASVVVFSETANGQAHSEFHWTGQSGFCNDCVVACRSRPGLAIADKKLTHDSSVLDSEQLGLVVARDCGVRVDISRQHGQAGGQVSGFHPFFF